MLSLENAVVYDEETFPNVYTIAVESLYSDVKAVWQISDYRDDTRELFEWIDYMASSQTPMIGFNNVGFDYPVLHYIRTTPGRVTAQMIYEKAMSIIGNGDRFGHMIWDRDRLIPQIDLMKIHHYDNMAKSTSLKALQINMRSPNVVESTVPFGTVLTEQQVYNDVIPYNQHDTQETKRFAHHSMNMIKFRIGLIPQFGIQVMNWNDTKLGEEMLIQRLGDDICYDRSSGKRQKRQTVRSYLPVKDMIFPYVQFDHPEFQRVLTFMQGVTLSPADMKKDDTKEHVSPLSVKAEIGGITFKFGSGGVHASVERQRFYADEQYCIRDVDVAGMYPSLSNVNQLRPEHLGEAFVSVYAQLPQERAQHAKGTSENLAFKLAGNAAWGKSKSPHSCFYDPKYALTVPINGQLLISMLVDKLLTIPTLQIIQANTDGTTYHVKREYLPQCEAIEKWWEAYTCMVLEHVHYKSMFVRDVNNYISVYEDGKMKLKGAYWSPKDFQEALDSQSAHKDYNPVVVQKAAVAAMVHGIDPEIFIRCHTDPFDFMCRIKVNRGSNLTLGDNPVQSTTRYYVSTDGKGLVKHSPPPAGFEVGMFKKAMKVTNVEYFRVMRETNGAWDERVCSKNKSTYQNRATNIQAGWLVTECNNADHFKFDNINYDWYVSEAKKLII